MLVLLNMKLKQLKVMIQLISMMMFLMMKPMSMVQQLVKTMTMEQRQLVGLKRMMKLGHI
jgi:hypothetical protein